MVVSKIFSVLEETSAALLMYKAISLPGMYVQMMLYQAEKERDQ